MYYLYFNEDKNYIVAKYAQIEEQFNAAISLVLFVNAAIIIFRKTKLFTYIISFDNIKWLKKFILLGSIILVTWIIAIVFNLDRVINPQIFIYYPLRLSSSILLFWLGYQGFFNYSFLKERMSLRRQIDNEIVEKETFTDKSSSHDSDFIIIQDFIIKNKKYRNPNLSIEKIAKETDFSTKKLSKLFKNNTQHGFVEYINLLQIEHAKKILLNPNYKNHTHVAIAFECGFNSKSTFYRVFKNTLNTTPTEYKQLNIS